MDTLILANAMLFLSTLSLRRATVTSSTVIVILSNFYPRSPCGERHSKCPCLPGYIHFYPRSPCGERLAESTAESEGRVISIHALLAESDSKSAQNSRALLRI